MDVQRYLDQSEKAARHLFEGLNEYDAMRLPSIMDFVDETGLVRMTKEENEGFLQTYGEYFALEFARASLAGSLLQVAYFGVNRYSTATPVSQRYSKFNVKAGTPAARFCLGREIKGIPEGLLIYAGRIQYNHWEEGEPGGTTGV